MTFSVEGALASYIQEHASVRLPDGAWHPSGLYACARKTVYAFRGTEESNPTDARTQRVFHIGHTLHAVVQAAVASDPHVIGVYTEVAIRIPELNIIGAGDQLVQFDDKTWELEEYKSINSMAFRYKDLPKADHAAQVVPYLKALREHGGVADDGRIIPPLGDGLRRARLTYLSKDDLLMEEHIVHWSEAKEVDLAERVAALEHYRTGDALPDRLPETPNKKSGKMERNWQCKYCSFHDLCWEAS